MNCVLCGQDVGPNPKTYELTPKESKAVKILGGTGDPVVFCQACDRLSKDARAFAEFMKGQHLLRLRSMGVPETIAEKQAEKVYSFYSKKAGKPSS